LEQTSVKHEPHLANHKPQPQRKRFVGWASFAGFFINSLPHFLISCYYTVLLIGPGLFFHIPLVLANAVGLATVWVIFRPPSKVLVSYAVGSMANFILSLPTAAGFIIYADLKEQKVTLLHLAAEFGQNAAAAMLIGKGADVNAADVSGRMPIYFAAQSGHVDVIKTLQVAGADIDQADSTGISPLGRAAAKGRVGAVVLLKELGADINKAGSDGRTPLSYAVEQGHMEMARTLIDAGADVDKPDAQGKTPRDWAAAGSIKMVEMLGHARSK